MKTLLILLLTVSCTAEVNDQNTTEQKENNTNMPSVSNIRDDKTICPPPIVLSILESNSVVERVFPVPCEVKSTITTPNVDLPRWNNQNIPKSMLINPKNSDPYSINYQYNKPQF